MFYLAAWKWLKDNFFLMLIVVVGAAGIYFAIQSYLGQVRQLAVAAQDLALQQKQISDLRTDFGKFKSSTETTLESLAGMRAEIERIDGAARQRDKDTRKRLEQIKNDPTLTQEQKDEEMSLTYAQSLRSTYCLYMPAKCTGPTAPPVEEKKP